ncbi:MAG: PleD family two-component system response regulator [Hoeflea sp.]|uniref:PleD family two-component system response regulator n=1 Tax=Hoeflea sp. TaxID=1940281 RepID=UPI000C0E430C|nr:PleD family two-component system response regulator [Hoeflea sp.]PHR22167.1 MAG: PleD family two-component system response regulator [Hoeflea sp.]|tara:strand:+ start:60787 stop:62160 length:1374 start_codon:yes stop_codon:yes gene_type:complete
MTARILVVDDIPANVKLLEARLMAEYFEVLTAADGMTALSICDQTPVDLILLDIMMPGIDGFEVCERLKTNPRTAHIPVVMVTALDQPADRVRGLKAGADDFLTKPVNDLQLMTRVKSLIRFKALSDELRLRAETARSIGLETLLAPHQGKLEEPGMVLLVESRANTQERMSRALSGIAEITAIADPQAALFEAADKPYELVIVSSSLEDYDPLRLCSQLRSLERTRFIPMLVVAEQGEDELVIRALELGVNDYLVRPLDPNELLARSVTQIRRKRYSDKLRASLTESVEFAVTDALTGLNNRRYLDTHLATLVDRSNRRGRPLSVLITDIDHFKAINDTHGHEGGDDVLRDFARRVRGAVRGADLACRYGGEEFVVVMPDTTSEIAAQVAERLREAVAAAPFRISATGTAAEVTTSVGIATLEADGEGADSLLRRADKALYQAKNNGRNRVVGQAA